MSDRFLFVQERAADDSKEVEGFQQLLLARTQVSSHISSNHIRIATVFLAVLSILKPSCPGVH